MKTLSLRVCNVLRGWKPFPCVSAMFSVDGIPIRACLQCFPRMETVDWEIELWGGRNPCCLESSVWARTYRHKYQLYGLLLICSLGTNLNCVGSNLNLALAQLNLNIHHLPLCTSDYYERHTGAHTHTRTHTRTHTLTHTHIYTLSLWAKNLVGGCHTPLQFLSIFHVCVHVHAHQGRCLWFQYCRR